MSHSRALAVDLPKRMSKGHKAVIQEFVANLPRADLTASIQNGQVLVELRQADLDSLTSLNEAICGRHNVPTPDSPANNVIRTIESIGSYGIRSGKRIYAGYNAERKVKNRKARVVKRGQHYYAAVPGVNETANALPAALTDRIVCADSLVVLRSLPDRCVDLVFTSPPYNFGLEYGEARDDNHWPKYFAALFEILDECVRVLKTGGRLIVNIQPLYSDYIPSHHFISQHLTGRGLIWKGEILWEKNNYNCKYTAWGSWKSPSNPYMKYTWEFIEVFSKGSLKKAPAVAGITSDLDGDEFKKWVYAKWSIAPERKMKSFGHPAMFPEEVARRVIKMFSFPGDVVLDPFNGAGTTTAVAARLKRTFLGIDVSSDYCATAEQRLTIG